MIYPPLLRGALFLTVVGKWRLARELNKQKNKLKKKNAQTSSTAVQIHSCSYRCYKQVMVYSLSSVARMKDCRVLSGRGGVRLRSAAQSNTSKCLHFLLGNSYLIHCFACKCFILKQDLKANFKARSYLWQAVG